MEYKTSGLVEEIENVNDNLSFVTLGILGNHTLTTKRQPVFMRLPQNLKDKVIDVINIRDNNSLKQYLNGTNIFFDASLTLSKVKQKLSDYLKSIDLKIKPELVFPYECPSK